MQNMKYVVYSVGRNGDDAGYWSGGFRISGRPNTADVIDGAMRFATAREAYAEAGKPKALQKWRVGARAG